MCHHDPLASPLSPEPPIDLRCEPFPFAPNAPADARAAAPAAGGASYRPRHLRLLGQPLSIQEAGCLALCGLWIALVHLRASEVVPRLWPLW